MSLEVGHIEIPRFECRTSLALQSSRMSSIAVFMSGQLLPKIAKTFSVQQSSQQRSFLIEKTLTMFLAIASITTLAGFHHASCRGNLLCYWWYL